MGRARRWRAAGCGKPGIPWAVTRRGRGAPSLHDGPRSVARSGGSAGGDCCRRPQLRSRAVTGAAPGRTVAMRSASGPSPTTRRLLCPITTNVRRSPRTPRRPCAIHRLARHHWPNQCPRSSTTWESWSGCSARRRCPLRPPATCATRSCSGRFWVGAGPCRPRHPDWRMVIISRSSSGCESGGFAVRWARRRVAVWNWPMSAGTGRRDPLRAGPAGTGRVAVA